MVGARSRRAHIRELAGNRSSNRSHRCVVDARTYESWSASNLDTPKRTS